MAFRWVFGQRPMAVPAGSFGPPPMEWTKTLSTRLLDATLPGFGDLDLGVRNLGIRTQVLELHPLGREEGAPSALLLPLEVPLDAVRAQAERLSQAFLDPGDVEPDFILGRAVGLRFSVVYSPIWCIPMEDAAEEDVRLLDALTGDLLKPQSPPGAILGRIRETKGGGEDGFGQMRFLPFRCPDCGWRFPLRVRSVLHLCPTCHRLWGERDGHWARIPYAVVPPPENIPWSGLLWVPFWRYRAGLGAGGRWIRTMAELYRLAPPPRLVQGDREAARPIYFFIPAMRLRNPNASQALASRLTFMQPDLPSGRFPDGFRPANAGGSLAEGDARQMGPIVLGAMMPPRNRQTREWLREAEVELLEPRILFLPFRRQDLFWKELRTGLSFQHNALSEDLPGEDQ
jgi:hypothetical protein